MADPVEIALGLMSGTSMDGIDAALIKTDGTRVLAMGPSLSHPYEPAFRAEIDRILGAEKPTPEIARIETQLTERHAEAINALLNIAPPEWQHVDVVGFHGQTIAHAPERRFTWQIGDGALLARKTGLPVVFDLRGADVAAGGQGAPFAPIYHQALAGEHAKPLAVLNMGGVGNLTFLPAKGDPIAFDTGPANGPVDDWMLKQTGTAIDKNGAAARNGQVDPVVLSKLMDHPYFDAPWPKSLDRRDFGDADCAGLSTEDGAATLIAFAAESVSRGVALMPTAPLQVLVTGGGRHNPALMSALSERLPCPVAPVEAAEWDGDMMEAQAFAFMAVRSRRGLPISFPTTTGAPTPMTGGRLTIAA